MPEWRIVETGNYWRYVRDGIGVTVFEDWDGDWKWVFDGVFSEKHFSIEDAIYEAEDALELDCAFRGCWSCGEHGPCDEAVCRCAKCVDPKGYAKWRKSNPEAYADWLGRQALESDDDCDCPGCVGGGVRTVKPDSVTARASATWIAGI